MTGQYTVEKIRSFRHQIEELAQQHEDRGDLHTRTPVRPSTQGTGLDERTRAVEDLTLAMALKSVGDLASLLLEVADNRESDKEVAALMNILRDLDRRLTRVENEREKVVQSGPEYQ